MGWSDSWSLRSDLPEAVPRSRASWLSQLDLWVSLATLDPSSSRVGSRHQRPERPWLDVEVVPLHDRADLRLVTGQGVWVVRDLARHPVHDLVFGREHLVGKRPPLGMVRESELQHRDARLDRSPTNAGAGDPRRGTAGEAATPPMINGATGSPQEKTLATDITATMASPTASTGGVDDSPRPMSDSPGDTSSPSAGNNSQPST